MISFKGSRATYIVMIPQSFSVYCIYLDSVILFMIIAKVAS